MYLLSWIEDEAKVEASLGGRITADEMSVVFEEIRDVVDSLESRPFLFQLDYSRAKHFDAMTHMVLEDLKSYVLSHGALKVATVLRDEDDVILHTNACLQHVVDGREQFVLEPEAITWPALPRQSVRSKAA